MVVAVGVGNRKRAQRSTDEEEDAEHDDESVEQGRGDPVLTRRSVDGGEEEESSDESAGEVDTEDKADGDEAGDVGCDCDLELDVKKSAVYRHLVGHPNCCHSYSDSSFTVLCRVSHTHIMQLKVFRGNLHSLVQASIVCTEGKCYHPQIVYVVYGASVMSMIAPTSVHTSFRLFRFFLCFADADDSHMHCSYLLSLPPLNRCSIITLVCFAPFPLLSLLFVHIRLVQVVPIPLLRRFTDDCNKKTVLNESSLFSFVVCLAIIVQHFTHTCRHNAYCAISCLCSYIITTVSETLVQQPFSSVFLGRRLPCAWPSGPKITPRRSTKITTPRCPRLLAMTIDQQYIVQHPIQPYLLGI